MTVSVPSVYALLLLPGGWAFLAHEWSFHSNLLEMVILIGPLVLVDFSAFTDTP